MALAPVLDGRESLTFIAGELPWHFDEPVRFDLRHFDDCNRCVAESKEYLPLAWQLHHFMLVEVFLSKKCPGCSLLASHGSSCKTLSHLTGPSE
ncbi:MAG TPA: hypothetical protein VGF51_04005 [Acidimicrobiales bacterium]